MNPFCLVVAAGSSQLGPETLVDRAQPLNEDIDLVSRYWLEVLLVNVSSTIGQVMDEKDLCWLYPPEQSRY
jgi:hypothetical protein